MVEVINSANKETLNSVNDLENYIKEIFQKSFINAQNALFTQNNFTGPGAKNIQDEAKTFVEQIAKSYANILSDMIAPTLATAIDYYIKNRKIIITPKKLTAPNGPVTGVITPDEIEIK